MEVYDEPFQNGYQATWNNVPEMLILDDKNIPVMASAKVRDKPLSPFFGTHLKSVTLAYRTHH